MLDVSAGHQTSTRRIRLVIADRQPIVLQGVRSVFAAQHDFEIVASCSDGTSCLEAIRNLAPDVALLADTLPCLTASEILAIAKAENLPTRLVFFTESESDDDLIAAIAAGACSAISKYANPDTLLRSVRLMTERSASPEQSQCLSPNGKEADGAKIEKMLGGLTHRERQIARLVSEGMSNKEIAHQLNVSHGTVKVHLHNIFQKLEISNRTVLATIALLQRPAAVGTLSLAALAFAILDEVKASETNGTFLDDADNGLEHHGFEIWKKAILRHVIVVDPGERVVLTESGSSTKMGQVMNAAAGMEAHAAEQAVTSNFGRGYGPVGSGTPYLSISPLLQAINNSQIGSPTTLEFASNPMKSHGGYGAFTAVAGAWIYALDHSHAAVQSLDFTSGADRINLAAFGALTFLQMTSASTSVPPRTLAWIYNPATNETIVYVNPTDRSLDIGDAGLLEIHLPGVVSVAESDFVYQGEAAALEGIDAALLVATASDGTVLTTDSVHGSIDAEASESAIGAAGVWTMPADDGFRFHFGQDRIGSNVSAKLTRFGNDSADATEESDAPAGVSAHVSSIAFAPSNATVPAVENLAFKTAPIHSNTGALSTGHGTAVGPELFEPGMQSAAISAPVPVPVVEPGVAPGNSAGHGNSQRASESASAQAAATEMTEPGVGHGNSAHSPHPASASAMGAAEPIETGVAPGNSAGHGNSQHASESASAKAAATGQAEPGVAPGNSAAHGNSQRASESASAQAAATELAEPDIIPGNGVGHVTGPQASNSAAAKAPTASEIAEPGVGHGNSAHSPHPASASATATAEPIETGVAPGNGAGHGNSQHASQSAVLKPSEAAHPAESASETADAGQEPAFRFNNLATPSTPTAVVEMEVLNDSPVPLSHDVALAAILEAGAAALDEHVASHGHHHVKAHLPHDLLI
ncbi:MAG: response regulator transcription factor [Bradyrhizobium sp.]|uniref:response regulator transcription factor n=1 Tax=Bradyrhizobium sp. TaxID=376 RepID=UPI00273144BD|nr:response regulator transcription factor [Bradyrhizobium sp.]MDP1869768.1 response regulator transcription factor [Bradyrhizobium sp.]